MSHDGDDVACWPHDATATKADGDKTENKQAQTWRRRDGGKHRTSDNEDGAPGAAWKVAEAARRLWTGATYLALVIVPPLPLVTQTNKTARTYHRGAVSDLGLDAAVFFELDQIVERVPRPRARHGDTDA